MFNVFDYIKQYNRNNVKTYGDILNLDNSSGIENRLSNTEREIYNKYKIGDIQRFKISENRNLINNTRTNNKKQEISGIGEVIQIC